MTPMKLIQLGIDPRDKWLDLILERTRTDEGKSWMKKALTSQDSEKLEQSFYEFVDEQGEFVTECQDLPVDHEVRRNFEKYTPVRKSCLRARCMGKIDMPIFPCRKGTVPIAPHATKPMESVAVFCFEKLLFLNHLKIRCSSGDIYSQTFLTFSYKLACLLQ